MPYDEFSFPFLRLFVRSIIGVSLTFVFSVSPRKIIAFHRVSLSPLHAADLFLDNVPIIGTCAPGQVPFLRRGVLSAVFHRGIINGSFILDFYCSLSLTEYLISLSFRQACGGDFIDLNTR
jgi:hypothetical protein